MKHSSEFGRPAPAKPIFRPPSDRLQPAPQIFPAMRSAPGEALKAWFLGPRAENAELLERLMVEALRDHVFWRRNYHPEDGFTIRETDKRQPGYEDAVSPADPGAAGPAGRAQARRADLQRALQGPHDRRADDRRAGRLLRDDAVQPEQRGRRDRSGHDPAGAGGGGPARRHDRVRPRDGLGPSHLGRNDRQLRGALARPERRAISRSRRRRRRRSSG